ncbi:50S ribosomal protein L25 [Treponema porcinum]|uniref:Large ribosomal subunit protein bL25 n=1 Tax=Treponema porcinum TaxID=261392 RepID=A0A1T4JL00_TREPO|nr:50S ribosomal protein L25 [Treponema porcinum]SJZ30783.1 large subunit ribosomal protein L25 [Treponema porcinum]
MSKQTINAKIRTVSGKSAAKKLREAGSIPAVMYNDKGEATMLEVNAVEFNKVWRSITATTSIDLVVDGKKMPALIKDTEYNIRTDKVLHADFFVPAEDEKLKFKMKVQFSGSPAGVLKGGFMLRHIPEVTILSTLKTLPERIVVDVTALNIGDSFRVKDLKLDKGIIVLTDPEAQLVSISPAR